MRACPPLFSWLQPCPYPRRPHEHLSNPPNPLQVAREIFIHSQLDHPHVIGLFAAFEDQEKVYLLQEYAEGVRSERI